MTVRRGLDLEEGESREEEDDDGEVDDGVWGRALNPLKYPSKDSSIGSSGVLP